MLILEIYLHYSVFLFPEFLSGRVHSVLPLSLPAVFGLGLGMSEIQEGTLVLFVCVDALHPSQHFFSHVGPFSCLLGLNKY